MRKIAAALFSLFASSTIAAESGFYVDAGIGSVNADLPAVAGASLDDKDTGYSLGIGYNINKYVAVEAGYQYLGEASYSSSASVSGTYSGVPFTLNGTARLATEDTSGWYIGPKFTLPINEKFELNARAGWFMWETTVNYSASLGGTVNGQPVAAAASTSRKFDDTDMYFGVGAAYNIDKNIAIGVDYTRFTLDDYDIDTWNLKAKYSF